MAKENLELTAQVDNAPSHAQLLVELRAREAIGELAERAAREALQNPAAEPAWAKRQAASEHPLCSARALSPPTEEQTERALSQDAAARKVLAKQKSPKPGALVGSRLNLNALKASGVAVQTLHEATSPHGHERNKGFFRGEALGYAPQVTLKNAFFNVDQRARELIASGQSCKFPMASIDGELAGPGTHSHDGVELMFNPIKHHLFVDGLGRAVHSASEVTIVAHRAYARGEIVYHDELSAPKKMGSAPSLAKVIACAPRPAPGAGSR